MKPGLSSPAPFRLCSRDHPFYSHTLITFFAYFVNSQTAYIHNSHYWKLVTYIYEFPIFFIKILYNHKLSRYIFCSLGGVLIICLHALLKISIRVFHKGRPCCCKSPCTENCWFDFLFSFTPSPEMLINRASA